MYKNVTVVVFGLLVFFTSTQNALFSAIINQIDPIMLQELEKKKEQKLSGQLEKAANILATCCNETPSGCVPTTPPVTLIHQSDIPIWITCPGTYQLAEDIFFDADVMGPDPNPIAPFTGPMAIGINAPNVVLDLNQHTITYQASLGGSFPNGIVTYDTMDESGNYIAQANNVLIKNGSVVAGVDAFSTFSNGIHLTSSDVTVKNILAAGGFFNFVAEGIVAVLDSSNNLVTVLASSTIGMVFDHCYATLGTAGFGAYSSVDVTFDDCFFEQNMFGVDVLGTLTMTNCVVSDSLLTGVAAGDGVESINWNIRNCAIFNSGTIGLKIMAAQNVLVRDTQIAECGSDGVIVGLREGKNVHFERVQVFNAGGILLRVENIDNFKAVDCQFTNYKQNPLPNDSPPNPLVRIEDAFNARLSNCLLNSDSGTSDGCLIRNSQGVICEDTSINITSTLSFPPPSGFVLQGSVTSSQIRNCSVNGVFSQGISLVRNDLNGCNRGIVLESNTIEGALDHGIFVSNSSNCTLLGNIVARNKGNGITLDSHSAHNQVRDNTLMQNASIGLLNEGRDNSIYHNFASNNRKNYSGVELVSKPGKHVGVLDNISSK